MKSVLVFLCLLPTLAAADMPWAVLVQHLCPPRGVPAVVADTVIRVESAGRPYALNVNGRSVMSASHAEAAQHLREALQQTTNVDIGLMQLNWRTWANVLQIDPVLLLDPAFNIRLGCTLLGGYIARAGSFIGGMVRYHSATPAHQARYAKRLYAAIGK